MNQFGVGARVKIKHLSEQLNGRLGKIIEVRPPIMTNRNGWYRVQLDGETEDRLFPESSLTELVLHCTPEKGLFEKVMK